MPVQIVSATKFVSTDWTSSSNFRHSVFRVVGEREMLDPDVTLHLLSSPKHLFASYLAFLASFTGDMRIVLIADVFAA